MQAFKPVKSEKKLHVKNVPLCGSQIWLAYFPRRELMKLRNAYVKLKKQCANYNSHALLLLCKVHKHFQAFNIYRVSQNVRAKINEQIEQKLINKNDLSTIGPR